MLAGDEAKFILFICFLSIVMIAIITRGLPPPPSIIIKTVYDHLSIAIGFNGSSTFVSYVIYFSEKVFVYYWLNY